MAKRGARWLAAGIVAAMALAACGPNLALLDSSAGLDVYAIAFGAGAGYAVGLEPNQHRAVLLRAANGAWALDPSQPPVGNGDELRALAFDGATLWVAGANSDAQHGQNAAVTGFAAWRGADGAWHRQHFDVPLNAIAFPAPGDGWAVGGNGAIYHGDGAAWTVDPDGQINELKALAFRSPRDGWAVGMMGTLLHYDGTGWTMPPHLTHTDLLAIALTAGDGWLGATEGEVFELQPDGWLGVTAPITTVNRAVVIDGPMIYIAGDHGAVFVRDNTSSTWGHLPQPADVQLNALARAPDGTLWAGGDATTPTLYAYAGGAWRTVTVPLS